MKYELKPGVENFEMVDGPFAGKTFVKGRAYKEIPPSEKNKFQPVKENDGDGPEEKKSKRSSRKENES